MARAAGYRTGLYTSPHLERVEERLRIDGGTIEPGRFGALLAEIWSISPSARRGPLRPTSRRSTLAAFRWFAEDAVDLAVLEVGLGGRLDATNLGDPILSLITPIGFDHQEYLGDTLAAIAREKAGILRPAGRRCAWIEEPEAAEAVREAARRRSAPTSASPRKRCGSRRSSPKAGPASGSGSRRRSAPTTWRSPCSARTRRRTSGSPCGRPRSLAGLGFDRIGPDAIRDGAAACRWPGRLEAIELPGGRRILLDAAHNPAGAEALAAFLDRTGTAGRSPLRRARRQGLRGDARRAGAARRGASSSPLRRARAPRTPRSSPPACRAPRRGRSSSRTASARSTARWRSAARSWSPAARSS